MTINYSAFDKKYPLGESVSAAIKRFRNYLRAANPATGVIIAVSFLGLISGALALTVMAFSDYSSTNDRGSLNVGLLFLAIDVAAAALILYGLASYGKRALVYETFANDNGFQFQPMFSVRNTNSHMFKMGYMQIARNAVIGTLDGSNFAVFEYRYTTGNARYQGPVIFTVLALNTGKEFPHIVLENKHGHLVLGKTRPPAVQIDTPLTENFHIYSSSGEITSASSVLNPTTIGHLLQASPQVDVELNGKDVFVFVKNKHNKLDKQVVESLLKAAQSVKT